MSFLSGRTSITTVQTADLADNAITLAKMAHGTASQNIAYDGSGVPVDVALSSFYPGVDGMTLSDDTDTDHDINITAGECWDATGAEHMTLASEITKRIDAGWAVGNDAGGLDTGSVATDTMYALWLIKRSDTDVVDVLFSTSFTGPTMPSNYDFKRLIGAVLSDGSSNIINFIHDGDEAFMYGSALVKDIADNTITNNAEETGTLSVPPESIAILAVKCMLATNSYGWLQIYTAPGAGFAGGENAPIVGAQMDGNWSSLGAYCEVLTDSSKQFKYRLTENTSATSFDLWTVGFRMITRNHP